MFLKLSAREFRFLRAQIFPNARMSNISWEGTFAKGNVQPLRNALRGRRDSWFCHVPSQKDGDEGGV